MERTKRYTIIPLLFVFSFFTLSAQYKQDIYNAYINSNMDGWKMTIDEMELKQNKSDAFRVNQLSIRLYWFLFRKQ